MDALFLPSLVSYLQPRETTVFLLSSGAVLQESKSFDNIVKFVRR